MISVYECMAYDQVPYKTKIIFNSLFSCFFFPALIGKCFLLFIVTYNCVQKKTLNMVFCSGLFFHAVQLNLKYIAYKVMSKSSRVFFPFFLSSKSLLQWRIKHNYSYKYTLLPKQRYANKTNKKEH